MKTPNKKLTERIRTNSHLGHTKRDEAFVRQVTLACSSQGMSIAQSIGTKAKNPLSELMSFYRFVKNDQVKIEDIRTTQAKVVLEEVPAGSELLIVHDVSQLDYSNHSSKKDRRLIGNHIGKGYEYHCCMAIEPQTGSLLGVLHDTLINKQGPDDKTVMDYDYEPLFADFSKEEKKQLRTNHHHQMAVHVRGLSPLLKHHHAIHVADREFDDIFILDQCIEKNTDFVIRMNTNRNVQVPQASWITEDIRARQQTGHPCPKGWCYINIKKLIPVLPMVFYKELPLNSLGHITEPSTAVRTAKLWIGTTSIRLYRNARRNRKYFRTPRPVMANLVVIREICPTEGVTPVQWVLVTSLPNTTFEELVRIADFYGHRWGIEPFFRLLKSGYHIEESRLDNTNKIAKLMVILSLSSMFLLRLKTRLNLPSCGKLDASQYKRIKHARLHLDDHKINFDLRLFSLIINLGGWLGRKNDPIGPAILMRGMSQFLSIFHTLESHYSFMKEALQHPDILEKMLGITFDNL